MINPVILVGLVNNGRAKFKVSSEEILCGAAFRFQYLNIPDNDQNVLHQEKFQHFLSCFLAEL